MGVVEGLCDLGGDAAAGGQFVPLLLTVVVAIVATVALTVATGEPKKSMTARRGAE